MSAPMSALELLRLCFGPESEWSSEESDVIRSWLRVADGAAAQGVAQTDILRTLVWAQQGYSSGPYIKRLQPLADRTRRQLAALAGKRSCVDKGRKAVLLADDKRLLQGWPVKTARYRELARLHGLKVDQVRYQIDGPRRRKRK